MKRTVLILVNATQRTKLMNYLIELTNESKKLIKKQNYNSKP